MAPAPASVLLLYAGGTIGMVRGRDGAFEPSSGFLTDTLRAQSRFHDAEGTSIFSWSSSHAHYQAWSQANQSQAQSRTPTPSPTPTPAPAGSAAASIASKRVKSSSPTGTSTRHALSSTLSSDGTELELELPTLVTPRSSGGRRVAYAVLEYEPLLDSSEMSLSDWTRLAKDIELNYASFDGFVIVHGTDTAAYTASALSFLLENLGKCVIVTGSQVPLSQLRNDAVENLLGALFLAGNYIIPEVTLFFSSKLFRGSRVSKVSNNALAAFDSPNMAPLATVGINIEIAWNLVARPTGLDALRVHTEMDTNVAVLRLFPGLSPSTIRTFLAPPLRGCVLESYGAGNAPTSPEFLAALQEASQRGCVIVNTTQCLQGEVSPIYAVGRKLQSIGVVAGGDMTPEAALTKLAYLLAKPELSSDQVRELMGRSLRGELTYRGAPSPPALSPGERSVHSLLARVLGRRPTTNADEEALSEASPARSSRSPDQGNEEDVKLDPPRPTRPPEMADAIETDVAAAERILLPYLIHRAVLQNDIAALRSHLEAFAALESLSTSSASAEVSHLVPSITTTSASIPPVLTSSNSRDANLDHDPAKPSTHASSNSLPTQTSRTSALDALHPLHAAAAHNAIDATELLLSLGGCSVHLPEPFSGRTPLFVAASHGHAGVVRVLRRAGAHLRGEEEVRVARSALERSGGGGEGERACWREALGMEE